jgi:hypothetical protein
MGIPMSSVGGLLRNLGGEAAKLLQRDMMSGALRAGLSPRSPMTYPQALKATVNMRAMQAGAPAAFIGADATQNFRSTQDIENALNQIGPAIDRTVSNIIPPSIRNSLNQFASEQEKQGFGGALALATPFGFLASPVIPNIKAQSVNIKAGSVPLNGIRTGKYGPTDWEPQSWMSAQRSSQQAPSARSVPSSPLASTGSPAERAYAAEKERAQQLTAQDPLFKKYQIADLTKQYNTATGDDRERIGLQIWAQTNPRLAAKLRPGQIGYAEMQAAPGYNTGLGTTTSSFGQYTQGVTTPNVDIDSNTFTKRLPSDLLSSVGITTPSSLEGMPFAPGKGLEQLLPNVNAYNTQIDFNAFRPNLEEKQRQLLIQAYNRGLK